MYWARCTKLPVQIAKVTCDLSDKLVCFSCRQIHKDAKLIDVGGLQMGNYSAEYLTYTEAKWVHGKAKNRGMYLEDVKRIRGLAAYEKLRTAMLKIHFGTK
jgi:hypothetical protein